MKIKLAVLFGGQSVEHEISVISAIQAIGYVNREKYDVIPIYITKDNMFYYGEGIGEIESYKNIPALLSRSERVYLAREGSKTCIFKYTSGLFGKKPLDYIDVAFPIVHGTNVEDGTLQGFLKLLGLPFVGCDVYASAVCMDKVATKALLKEAGIPVLDGLSFSSRELSDIKSIVKQSEERFSYPVIVKPVNLGSSVGVTKARDAEELEQAVSNAFMFAKRVLIEPAVVALKEINCAVLGDSEEAIPSECEEPCSSDTILSYSDKYLSSSKQSGSKGMASLKRKIPADISNDIKKNIQDIAVRAFQTLDCCGVARIDFLMDYESGHIWLNELNTIPGSLSFYLWEPLGISYPELIERLVSLALKRQRLEEGINYSFDTNILSLGGGLGSKRGKA